MEKNLAPERDVAGVSSLSSCGLGFVVLILKYGCEPGALPLSCG